MSRYVKTVAAADGSGGGGSAGQAGLSAAQACQYACKAVCDMFCTNFKTPACRPYYNFLPTTTVNDWVVICHCDCWTSCYGCKVTWCLDTAKYRAFKWCFKGIRIRGCCYFYGAMGMAAKGVECYCCCNNAWLNSCNFYGSPPCMCCNACWQCWNACHIGLFCQHCCQAQCDGVFNMGWCIFPVGQSREQNQYRTCNQIGYRIWLPDNYDKDTYRGRCEVFAGTSGYCHRYITWSPEEACKSSTCYLDRWCLNVEWNNNYGFESASCGNYPFDCHAGTDVGGQPLPKGVTPMWTIWGIPCCYPMNIGTISMGTGCIGNAASFPTIEPNVDWVQPTEE